MSVNKPVFIFRCVKGLHLNMCMSRRGFKVLLSLLIGPYLPFLVGLTREDVRRLFPFFEKNVWEMLRESGYMHIQGTKPDTAGETTHSRQKIKKIPLNAIYVCKVMVLYLILSHRLWSERLSCRLGCLSAGEVLNLD